MKSFPIVSFRRRNFFLPSFFAKRNSQRRRLPQLVLFPKFYSAILRYRTTVIVTTLRQPRGTITVCSKNSSGGLTQSLDILFGSSILLLPSSPLGARQFSPLGKSIAEYPPTACHNHRHSRSSTSSSFPTPRIPYH